MPSNSRGGKETIGGELEIYIFLWYVANTVTYRQLGHLFGIAKSSAWSVISRVSKWLVSLSHEYIRWPNQHDVRRKSAEFEALKGMKGIIGAIDGTHIKIKAPKYNTETFFNRKKYYSLAMQVVVDANKKFIDIYCGEPGSLHDSRIFRRSNLYSKATERQREIFPDDTFLIGDSAYPLMNWIVPPFRDTGNLSARQKAFNIMLSSTRVVVENAIGLLKARFRRLMFFTENTDLGLCVQIIVAACVLHNACLDHQDDISYVADIAQEVEYEHQYRNEQNENDRRQQLIRDLVNNGLLQ